MNEDIAALYSGEVQDGGGGDLPYFVGKQYGSGWFKTLARLAFPILKRIGKVAYNTVSDVLINNKSILPSLKSHAMDAVNEVMSPPSTKKRKQSHMNKQRRSQGTIFQR
jgi:hypothetical protein